MGKRNNVMVDGGFVGFWQGWKRVEGELRMCVEQPDGSEVYLRRDECEVLTYEEMHEKYPPVDDADDDGEDGE